MYKLILFLLLGLINSGAIASHDAAINASKNDLILRHTKNNKVSRIEIGSKVIVKTPLGKYRGVLHSVGLESLTIENGKKYIAEVEIKLNNVNVIIKRNGLGYRFLGSVIEVGAGLITAGIVTYAVDYNPEILAPTLVLGLGGIYLGHLMRGKKYKMSKWQIIQNKSGQ
jgi:hypothetical protein